MNVFRGTVHGKRIELERESGCPTVSRLRWWFNRTSARGCRPAVPPVPASLRARAHRGNRQKEEGRIKFRWWAGARNLAGPTLQLHRFGSWGRSKA